MPWDRLPEERDKPYTAFQVYLNLGVSRSLLKVAAELSKSEALIKRWSAEFGWVERARAFDADLAYQAMEGRREAMRHAASDDQLEAFRERVGKNATLLDGAGKAFLETALMGIDRIRKAAKADPNADVIIPASLTSALRAAAMAIQAGADQSAVQLGIEDLLGVFRTQGFDEEG
jgi:hypothetical protein